MQCALVGAILCVCFCICRTYGLFSKMWTLLNMQTKSEAVTVKEMKASPRAYYLFNW